MQWGFRDDIQLSATDHGNTIGSADPEVPDPVFKEFVDAVAGEPLRSCKVCPFHKPPTVKTPRTGAVPQPAVGVFMNRPDLFLLKCVSGRVFREATALQMANAAVGPDPYVSIVIFRQCSSTEITQPITLLITGKVAILPVAYSLIGGDPYAPVPALQKGTNKIVHQAILDHIVGQFSADLPEHAPAFGSDPQSTLMVAEDVSDTHAANSR